ncbi:unnamed protein product, partial [Phaeothamnion confervicola]
SAGRVHWRRGLPHAHQLRRRRRHCLRGHGHPAGPRHAVLHGDHRDNHADHGPRLLRLNRDEVHELLRDG